MYAKLLKYLLNEESLCSNQYPRPHPQDKNTALIHLNDFTKAKFADAVFKDNKKKCTRCRKIYAVNKNGFQVSNEQCLYHWGKIYKPRGKFKNLVQMKSGC